MYERGVRDRICKESNYAYMSDAVHFVFLFFVSGCQCAEYRTVRGFDEVFYVQHSGIYGHEDRPEGSQVFSKFKVSLKTVVTMVASVSVLNAADTAI